MAAIKYTTDTEERKMSMTTVNTTPPFGRRLEGKVAIVTGGASGIGEATARLFCEHGAKVVITDIQDELGKSVCQDIGIEVATYIHCNVSIEEDVKKAIDFTVTKYGKLDIMFNNAGIADPPQPRIWESDTSDFERALRVNVTGVFLGIKHAARIMAAAKHGSIINNGSVCSVVGGMAPHGYVASKHAVVGFTKNAAAELGKYGIRVNCISPFLIATTLTTDLFDSDGKKLEELICKLGNLKGVVSKPEDIAQAAVFFGSEESKYVSGHNFVVDGGFSVVNTALGPFGEDS